MADAQPEPEAELHAAAQHPAAAMDLLGSELLLPRLPRQFAPQPTVPT
eukprot:SAG31_NODE_2748_length_5147_cov_2.564184_3_plen_48_part_00